VVVVALPIRITIYACIKHCLCLSFQVRKQSVCPYSRIVRYRINQQVDHGTSQGNYLTPSQRAIRINERWNFTSTLFICLLRDKDHSMSHFYLTNLYQLHQYQDFSPPNIRHCTDLVFFTERREHTTWIEFSILRFVLSLSLPHHILLLNTVCTCEEFRFLRWVLMSVGNDETHRLAAW
jgi:hypothetical protein